MNWIKSIFNLFNKGEEKPLSVDVSVGFTDEQKTQIVESAITASAQVLISAAVMTDSHNKINGDVLLPDGSKWRLTFQRILYPKNNH